MKQQDDKIRDSLLHRLLDETHAESEAGTGLTGPEAAGYSRYREGLAHLENHQEKAPADFTSRVMAALPEKPHLSWVDRLKSFWPEGRFWAIPGIAGALAMLVLLAGLTLFQSSEKSGLIPVALDLYAPSADRVQLVGTFSGWMPEAYPLKGPDAVGYWVININLPPGRHEYAFLVNGSRLVPDDDGEVLRPDGYGLQNSLLFVDGDMSEGVKAAAFPGPVQGTVLLPAEHEDQWLALLNEGKGAGIQDPYLRSLLAKMAASKMAPAEAREILAPLIRDGRSGLNLRYVLLRLDEGLLKKFPMEELKKITLASRTAFLEAGLMLARSGYEPPAETYPALLDATAFAIESGFSPASLNAVLNAGKDRKPRQITEVLELGETLFYAGLENEALLSLMQRCLVKNLDVQQMERVTDHVRESLLKGENHQIIIDTLWIQAFLRKTPQLTKEQMKQIIITPQPVTCGSNSRNAASIPVT